MKWTNKENCDDHCETTPENMKIMIFKEKTDYKQDFRLHIGSNYTLN